MKQKRLLVALLLMTQWMLPVWGSLELEDNFKNPKPEHQPWAFWYWLHGAVSEEGITADLEAMHANGIGGALLMSIKGPEDPSLYANPTVQLTERWWDMLEHTFNEADRIGVNLGMHASDGFALAGGPWITPQLSMQRLVWTTTLIESDKPTHLKLQQPLTRRDYYRDVAVLAFPSREGYQYNSQLISPEISSNIAASKDLDFLCKDQNKLFLESSDAGWIQYDFKTAFTCRSITIRLPEAPNAYQPNTYQANHLLIQISDDGVHFKDWIQLNPPRHGWQDGDLDITHAIPEITAKAFRFVFHPEDTEVGAEDLDSAKWKPKLKISGIDLSGLPVIHQYEGKSGAVWRIAPRTTATQLSESSFMGKDEIIDLTSKMRPDGTLDWTPPPGVWTVMRFGHTSTGQQNSTGGGGLGLECDKFNPEAAKIQFEGWFGKAYKQIGEDLCSKVLKVFHVDSWECGSQNWSSQFPKEFSERRGYDLVALLPVMAGVPVESIMFSENVLKDVRETIAELVSDNFYHPLAVLAESKGCQFSAECVSPTMVSDGMSHYREVDIPMGEFWLRSATHDKLNDILDAISAAHVYGKPIVQAEAFTEIHLAWDEHPAMLKALGDRNYALGINRFVYHVFMHNPWIDRAPGMTLNGVGLYFQRNQTWWEPGKAWVDYAQRCQALLQSGVPVVDIGVFTGEDIPRRSIVPWHLKDSLPGFFPEKDPRMEGQLLKSEDWMNVLQGYAYDSINPEALMELATVKNGSIHFPGGVSYALLVMPAASHYNPSATVYSPELLQKVHSLIKDGATVLFTGGANLMKPNPSLNPFLESIRQNHSEVRKQKFGKGLFYSGKLTEPSFESLGLLPDATFETPNGKKQEGMVWNHRRDEDTDIYFIANQLEQSCEIIAFLKTKDRIPEIWNPVTGTIIHAKQWESTDTHTQIPLRLAASESVFVVFRQPSNQSTSDSGLNWFELGESQRIDGSWNVEFNPASNYAPSFTVEMDYLQDWSESDNPDIRYFSGTAIYRSQFKADESIIQKKSDQIFLDLGKTCYMGEVILNGVNCGIAWTAPWRVDITRAIRSGVNDLEIRVTNTWFNRLAGDQKLPEDERKTQTTAPERTQGKPLLKSGLLGPIQIQFSEL